MKSTHKKSKRGKVPKPVKVSAITARIKLTQARWLVPVIVTLLTGVAFLPALQNGFIWDDETIEHDRVFFDATNWGQQEERAPDVLRVAFLLSTAPAVLLSCVGQLLGHSLS